MLHVLTLVGCAVAIYLACEWFVNAVEWLGARLGMAHTAVGTVLAAAGTALPESVVTLVAVLFGTGSTGDDIAVGAALGGPLVVGTLAYAVAGVVLVVRHRAAREKVRTRGRVVVGAGGGGVPGPTGPPPSAPDPFGGAAGRRRLARDQGWFLAIFAVKVALGLVAFAYKPWLGIAFFAAYAVYFWRETSADRDPAKEAGLAPLKLQRHRAVPSTAAIVAQTLGTLVVIFAASELFVRQLEWAGPALGLSPVVVALLLAPVATELPEIMNAIIWVRQGKPQLALANISGSMMIQATVPSGIGLLCTPWLFDGPLVLAGSATLASVTYLWWLLRSGRMTARRLAGAAGFYAAFAVGLVLL